MQDRDENTILRQSFIAYNNTLLKSSARRVNMGRKWRQWIGYRNHTRMDMIGCSKYPDLG